MKTLIELYDERPLLNVLCTEMFKPERTVFVCPPEVGKDTHMQRKMRDYFACRGINCELIFKTVSLVDAFQVEVCLRELTQQYPDCVIDVAGGTDAALFASGALCALSDVPAFTYSRRRNTFYNIRNAAFAHDLPCTVKLSVRDSFEIAGGSMRTGRVGDDIDVKQYMALIDRLFAVYLKFRRDWPKIINYMQRISQSPEGVAPALHVEGAYVV